MTDERSENVNERITFGRWELPGKYLLKKKVDLFYNRE